MNWKRWLYGLPLMSGYRDYRSRSLATRFRDHPLGFRFAGSEAYFSSDWEAKERAVIAEQLGKADVLIDVGANQGIYSCWAASMGKTVAAVEPEHVNLNFLMSNIAENGFPIELFPIAATERPGLVTIYGDSDIASMHPGWCETPEIFRQMVAGNSLDNLFAGRWPGLSVFVKIDVEGFESGVLKGACKLLRQQPQPVWLVETFPANVDATKSLNNGFLEVFELLSEAGYTTVCVETGEVLDAAEIERRFAKRLHMGGSNYLFLPASA